MNSQDIRENAQPCAHGFIITVVYPKVISGSKAADEVSGFRLKVYIY